VAYITNKKEIQRGEIGKTYLPRTTHARQRQYKKRTHLKQ